MRQRSCGFSLVELMLALALGAALTAGFLQLVSAGVSAARLQQELGNLQENARFALSSMAGSVRNAGFNPEPWGSALPVPDIDPATQADFSSAGDRLVVNQLSRSNCYGSQNPITDLLGNPHFYHLQNSFWVSDSNTLVRRCTYGPVGAVPVVQVNNLTVIEQIEHLALQFAEDNNGDARMDGWVRAGQWQADSRILGVRLGLLVASHDPLLPASSEEIELLGQTLNTPADGRLRRSFQVVWAIEGQRL